MSLRVALIGGRGYTGAEWLGLLAGHPGLSLAFASSESHPGTALAEVCPGWPDPAATFICIGPGDTAGQHADAWVLAVPNGAAGEWAAAIRAADPHTVILDLSADHRFDKGWAYGLPERFRADLRQSRNIANPGCYATGAQLALLPLKDRLDGVPVVFGVSGFSGAGRKPGERNDPERLRDNLIPYRLNGHLHEQEVSHQLQREIRFIPHVAGFFRGISLTVSANLDRTMSETELSGVFREHYRDEARVKVLDGIPEISGVRNTPDIHIGGFSVDRRNPRRVSWVAALDNLSKGAASQAMQNLNLALQLDENLGIAR